jgi:hypothetical protein
VAALELRGQALERGLRVVEADPVGQAAHGLDDPRAPVLEEVVQRAVDQAMAQVQGNPRLGRDSRRQPLEVPRGDADDRQVVAVDGQRLAYHARIGGEVAAPQAVADHRHRIDGVQPTLLLREGAAQGRLDPEDPEEVAGHQLDPLHLGLLFVTQARLEAHVTGQSVEHLVRVAQVAEIEEGDLVVGGALGVGGEEANQPSGVLHRRQRVQEDRVDEGEDGAVGADAEAQGDDGDKGEARSAEQTPEGVTEVASELRHGVSPQLLHPGDGGESAFPASRAVGLCNILQFTIYDVS